MLRFSKDPTVLDGTLLRSTPFQVAGHKCHIALDVRVNPLYPYGPQYKVKVWFYRNGLPNLMEYFEGNSRQYQTKKAKAYAQEWYQRLIAK